SCGCSGWLSLSAPRRGIAACCSLGSTFDTLLAIYTGTNLLSLSVEAADDERAGYANSGVVFNAVAGQQYAIAVDGLGGATGHIVLSWNLDSTASEFPHIIADPLSQSASAGSTATFQVTASSPTPMRFQWFFACHEIADATNSTLVVPNVQPR